MEQFNSLLKPRSLKEHHGSYLFNAFCDYKFITNGEVVNIASPGLCRLTYIHLVAFFGTVGKTFFPTINDKGSAEYILFDTTGISEDKDLQKLFAKENVHILKESGFTVPFVYDTEAPVTEMILNTKVASTVIPTPEPVIETAPKKRRGRKPKNRLVTEEPIPVPEESTAATAAISNTLFTEEEITETDIQEAEARRAKVHKRREMTKGRTRINKQHIGITVPRPIKEASLLVKSSSDSAKDYFILHGTPGKNDVVLAYPVEKGKTMKDYSSKIISASWKDPYLLALRHDYVERTGSDIRDVRKMQFDRWISNGRKKYLADKKANKKLGI